ncbi:MAG: transposase domain-containing protein [Alphaproteobacteria bacterium]|nr:transposase domain-containing protein [Alphaproteobacteria bacterium]MCB9697524.1 transposase domain-containing protein [Alphaproteobacteria bacterium]
MLDAALVGGVSGGATYDAHIVACARKAGARRLFLEHGELPMHNNLSELMLRQTVVGRKNWLFARSEGGAHAAAALYTLIGSCSLQGIDPWLYLRDLLDRLQDYPANRVGELTPKNWRAFRPGHTPPAG